VLERVLPSTPDPDRRLAAIATPGSAGATRDHVECLRDPDPLRAEAAARSAGNFRVRDAGYALAELARSGRDTRCVALWALARTGHRDAAGELPLQAVRPRLDRIASRRELLDGVRACAREASARATLAAELTCTQSEQSLPATVKAEERAVVSQRLGESSMFTVLDARRQLPPAGPARSRTPRHSTVTGITASAMIVQGTTCAAAR
jgi:hypothetical protein